MNLFVNILHWAALAGTFYFALRMFRDLADISQWFVRTSRAKTIGTFYNRHQFALAFLTSGAVAILTFTFFGAGSLWLLLPVLAISAFLFFSGYINPRFMMRAQQDSAQYFSIAEAKKHLTPDTSLIVMEAGGVARGHPDEHVLRPHVTSPKEQPGGDDVIMTYCGLTNMGIAYEPVIDGERVELGVMTQLENNLVMWDKKTGEPIQQFWGTLERTGPEGPRMPEWPSFRMPLSAFEKTYPNGEVFLNLIPTLFQNPFYAIYDRVIHMIFKHAIDLQAKNEAPAFPTIDHVDNRLPSKQKIYGANVGKDYVAYTKDFIRENGDLLNVNIDGQDIIVAYHEDVDSVGMYVNDTGKPVNQIAFGGAGNTGKLNRLATMKAEAYWIVWQNFFPKTDVNRMGV